METPTKGSDVRSRNWRKHIFILLNCAILSIGNCGGPLISRMYFVSGGTRIWFSSWLMTAAWPITFFPLAISYFHRLKTEGPTAKLFYITPKIIAATVAVGALNGLDNFLYAFGVAKLPVSTSALLIATQLAFTACFAFFLVEQKLTAYSVNAIMLLTMGAGVLAVGASSDRPAGESSKEYVLGFVVTLLAAFLYGLILPGIELVYKKANQAITYTLVLEIQMVLCFSATFFCTIGMIINKDFQALGKEAREFGMGESKYYVVVIWTSILWQLCFIGIAGVICYGSSLLSAVVIAMLLSVTEVLAVVFFGEKFGAQKGISLALSLWGFISYFYGEFKSNSKLSNNTIKDDHTAQAEISQTHIQLPI